MAFFQKEVWLLLIIHIICCSFHLQTYLSNIANNRCGQIYAMSPDNTCRARRPNELALCLYLQTNTGLCTKQLRDVIRIQVVFKTSNMVNGHHHHCGHHHHLSIITGWPLGGSRYLHRCESLAGLPH